MYALTITGVQVLCVAPIYVNSRILAINGETTCHWLLDAQQARVSIYPVVKSLANYGINFYTYLYNIISMIDRLDIVMITNALNSLSSKRCFLYQLNGILIFMLELVFY